MRRNSRRRALHELAAVRLALGTVGILVLAPGCASEAAGGGEWAGSIETLPNGGVRVTNPAEGLWSEETSWRLIPDLTIGAVDEPMEEVFSSISAMEVGQDGGIYVLDRSYNELRIFDAQGNFLTSVGRTGEGPGEFRAANGLQWLAADSLVVIDQQGARYSIVSAAGDFVRSVPRQLGFYGWVFEGVERDGRLIEFGGVSEGAEFVPALLSISLTDLTAPYDTALVAPGPDRESPSFQVSYDTGNMFLGIPNQPRMVNRIADSGVWHGYARDPRLYRLSLDGDTLGQVTMETERSPVSDEEIDDFLSSDRAEAFRGRGGVIDLDRIPRLKPHFDDVTEDEEGNVWISVPAPRGEILFDVLGSDLRYLGRLRAEGGEREAFVRPIVRGGNLYLVARDDLGVERVHRYRIEK